MYKLSKISLGIIAGVFLVFVYSIFLLSSTTFAAAEAPVAKEAPVKVEGGAPSCPPNELCNPLGTKSIEEVFARVIKGFLAVLGIAALLAFILGGFQWLTSGGNPERIKLGKSTMIWAALGILLAFSAYTFISYLITSLTTQVGA